MAVIYRSFAGERNLHYKSKWGAVVLIKVGECREISEN